VPVQNNNAKKPRSTSARNKKQHASAAAQTEEQKRGVIVQTKYDGDRLQAHFKAAAAAGGAAPITTTLFTRRGVDVTELYSSITQAVTQGEWGGTCVLDGELIVIETDGDDNDISRPLPWSNEKWRHNHRNAAGEIDSQTVEQLALAYHDRNDDEAIVMLEYEDTALAQVWEDAYSYSSSADVSFVPLSSLRCVFLCVCVYVWIRLNACRTQQMGQWRLAAIDSRALR
jgi:hypothetical protein